jgi:hypothetical protein
LDEPLLANPGKRRLQKSDLAFTEAQALQAFMKKTEPVASRLREEIQFLEDQIQAAERLKRQLVCGEPLEGEEFRPEADLPSIDFQKIRPHNGTQHAGFEELCVALFRIEHGMPSICRFHAQAGDGGVEAIAPLSCGGLSGLQTKYFRRLRQKEWKGEVEQSIERACETHPLLKRYFVAVPLDRSQTAFNQWMNLESKWRTRVELVFWGQSELIQLLSQERNHGLLRYWFGEPGQEPATNGA